MTRQCPAGEICSPETPSGLYFKGPDFGDDFWFPDHTVAVTAVEGTQSIEIDAAGWFESIYDFDADCSASPFSVIEIEPPFVTVRANSTGSSLLRILDRHNGELYDRLTIESLPVTAVEVAVARGWFLITAWEEHPTRLYYGGIPLRWLARLKSGDDRLVDESLTFTVPDTDTVQSITPARWDVADILPAGDATRLEVLVTTGSGETGSCAVSLAHEIDRIEELVGYEMPATQNASEMIGAKFVGLTADNREVAWLDWSVQAISPDGEMSDQAAMWSNVLFSMPDQVGVWTYQVSAANVTRVFEVTVTAPPPAPPPPPSPSGADERKPQDPDPQAAPAWGAPGWRAQRINRKARAPSAE
ncbi:MAG: hypothetical protein ABI333_07555 [bacterium]